MININLNQRIIILKAGQKENVENEPEYFGKLRILKREYWNKIKWTFQER